MGVLWGRVHIGEGHCPGLADRPRTLQERFGPGLFARSMEFVRRELPLLRLRRGIQGLPPEIRPALRQAILHARHRHAAGEQPPPLSAGTAVQHGIVRGHPQAQGRQLGRQPRRGGNSGGRQEAAGGAPVHTGRRRRGGTDAGFGQHSVPLREVRPHGNPPGHRSLPPVVVGGGGGQLTN